MANTNKNAEQILSTLNPEAAEALRAHFRAEAAQEIAAGLTGGPAPKARRTRGPAKGATRKVTNDGTERNASQFIRDCDDSMSAKEVVEAGAKVGLDIAQPLVYNVRAREAKKTAEAEDSKAAEAKAAETKAKRQAAAAKAREARAAKKAAAEK